MSIKQYPGGIITKNPTAPTTSAAKGIWTLDQAQNYTKQGIWPRSPGAPTIGTATGGVASATVAYTAPSDLGTGSISYQAISSPGGITGTGASPITVSGLNAGTSYTFTVVGITPGGTGPASAASNAVTPTAAIGQEAFTTAGSYSWVAPSGVSKVSVVAVGGGGATGFSGAPGGGGLGYKNNYSVTPGSSYTVAVGAAGTGSSSGSTSYFVSTCVVSGGGGQAPSSGGPVYPGAAGGTYTGDGGGNGGAGGAGGYGSGGAGGAGGYSGNGGAGGVSTYYCCVFVGTAGSAGSGGGGGGSGGCGVTGGGVGLLGQGSNGAGGTFGQTGRGGSGGGNGTGTGGGLYGGGGKFNATSGSGAVRIIWPGNTRSFPSTCTGNL